MQARSIAVYLGAFDDEGPVGHALLKLPPLGTEHPRRHGIPEIEDLFVSAACRSQGIGRRLLQELEVVARRRGFDRVGLAVGIDNPRARTLYAGEGYVDAGLDTFWVEGAHETCTYLVKELL